VAARKKKGKIATKNRLKEVRIKRRKNNKKNKSKDKEKK
jgi:hypothetical protein